MRLPAPEGTEMKSDSVKVGLGVGSWNSSGSQWGSKFTNSWRTRRPLPRLMPTALQGCQSRSPGREAHRSASRRSQASQGRVRNRGLALLGCLPSEAGLLSVSHPGTECWGSGKLLQMGCSTLFCHILRPSSYSATEGATSPSAQLRLFPD